MRFLPAGWVIGLLLPLLTYAQRPWTAATSPTQQTLWGVAYGEPGFVAVGENGVVITSTDGLAWQTQVSGTSKWLLGVTWCPAYKLYVAVGDAGTILTSPDGLTWTARTSGTSQRLNSVEWNSRTFSTPALFLAVGENGTALVSYDAYTWTPKNTGDAGWLRGIAKMTTWDGFIVTGHDGTILVTTNGGETFERRNSGTTRHLDAVTMFNNGFNATGADFAMTRSAGLTGGDWTFDPTVNPGGRENGFTYNGLVSFNKALVVAGDGGRILDEFGRRWSGTEALTTGWRAVAASPTRVVAVGTGGGIATAPVDLSVLAEIAISQSTVSGAIILTAKPVRSAVQPWSYQWSLNGTPVPGGTSATLSINTAASPAGGTYTATAGYSPSDFGGAVMTATASVTINPVANPPSLGLVDTTYQPTLTFQPQYVLPLSDGRVYAVPKDSAAVVRLTAAAAVDTTFQAPADLPSGRPAGVVLQPDGRLLIAIPQGSPQGSAPYALVRLNADGSRDPTFVPDATMTAAGAVPILLNDGRWLVPQLDDSQAADPHVRLGRYLANGALDTSYAIADLSPDPFTGLSSLLFTTTNRFLSTRDATGRIYLAVQLGDINGGVSRTTGKTRLIRLTADGVRDPTFAPRDLEQVAFLRAVGDRIVIQTFSQQWARLAGTLYTTQLLQLRDDGSTDPAYHAVEASWRIASIPSPDDGISDGFQVLGVAPDGSVIARSVGRLGRMGLVRFTASGDLDRDFSAELGTDAASVATIVPVKNDAVFVAGSFTNLLGAGPRYLARLTPRLHASQTYVSNISIRARVGGAAGTLIVGYITANGETSVLERGVGPALADFKVTGFLADPLLSLYSGTTALDSNDDWGLGPADFLAATAARVGAFPLAPNSRDAALYTTAPAGRYTILVSAKGSASGVALAEAYDAGAAPTDAKSPRFINVSARTLAGSGSDSLIAGFVITGDNTRNVLIRAIGPGLTKYGVPDALADPMLTVYRGETPLAWNDDWAGTMDVQKLLIEAARTCGAFPLDYTATYPQTASKDAAVLVSLPPGAYTVQVSGKNSTTGTALVEVYEVP